MMHNKHYYYSNNIYLCVPVRILASKLPDPKDFVKDVESQGGTACWVTTMAAHL